VQDAWPNTHALPELGLHVPPLDDVDDPELFDPPDIMHEPPMHI
jgi:hypothetical protein